MVGTLEPRVLLAAELGAPADPPDVEPPVGPDDFGEDPPFVGFDIDIPEDGDSVCESLPTPGFVGPQAPPQAPTGDGGPLLEGRPDGSVVSRDPDADVPPADGSVVVDPPGTASPLAPDSLEPEDGWHYGRNVFNEPPSTQEDAELEGWKRLSDEKSIYHKHDAPDNTKYVSPDGSMEAVYDGDGNLDRSDENQGTYNYSPPTDGLGHVYNDVIPYWFNGNTPDDTTNVIDRIFGAGATDGLVDIFTDDRWTSGPPAEDGSADGPFTNYGYGPGL